MVGMSLRRVDVKKLRKKIIVKFDILRIFPICSRIIRSLNYSFVYSIKWKYLVECNDCNSIAGWYVREITRTLFFLC